MPVRARHKNHSASRRIISKRRFESLEERRLLALTPELVADLLPGTTPGSSEPMYFLSMGDYSLFWADHGEFGMELWRSDGTAQGTSLVKDIHPGPVGANTLDNAGNMGSRDGVAYFVADDGVHGRELWRSDGTSQGTYMVVDLAPVGGAFTGDRFGFLGGAGDKLFFYSAQGNTSKLVVTDGSAAGTSVISTLNNRVLEYGADVGNTFYFAVSNDGLWKTDGTIAGTMKAGNVTFPRDLHEVNGHLVFNGTTSGSDREIWTSDGTPEGTKPLVEIVPGAAASDIRNLTHAGNRVYFTHVVAGQESLWRTDGTAAGTEKVTDVAGITRHIANGNGRLYFTVDRYATDRTEQLWSVEIGSAPVLVYSNTNFTFQPNIRPYVGVGDTMFFGQKVERYRQTLWKTEGNPASTMQLSTTVVDDAYYRMPFILGNKLLFVAEIGDDSELWTSDGTPLGTREVTRIHPGFPDSTSPTELVPAGDRLFFRAGGRNDSTGVWMLEKADGSLTKVYDPTLDPLYDDEESSYAIDELMNVGDRFYFTTHFECGGSSIWTVGPEEQQTRQVISYDFSSIWCYGAAPGGLTSAKGQLFFIGGGNHDNVDADGEPWVSDGTGAGTRLVRDINPGTYEEFGEYHEYRSVPQFFTEFLDEVYFTAQTGDTWEPNGTVWKTNGTTEGTTQLQPGCDEFNGNCAAWGRSYTPIGDFMIFSATNYEWGRELWITDGTTEGTRILKDIAPGEYSAFEYNFGSPTQFWPLNNRAFFAADNGVNGSDLWVSDGTEAGTVLVKDINPFGDSAPREGVELNGKLIFAANDGVHGEELWTSDGTAEGTRLLADIRNLDSSSPSELTRVGDYVFFTADDGVHGRELWVTDGTAAGTRMLEVRPGNLSSGVQNLTALDDTLYFSANDGVRGQELWKVLVDERPANGDTDGDGDVDLNDLNNVRNYFGATGENQVGDTDGNGVVDLADLNAVRGNFGNVYAVASKVHQTSVELRTGKFVASPSTASLHDAVFSQLTQHSLTESTAFAAPQRKLAWSRVWR